jgi:selenocysteine lyase/cysteine desulfurase
LEPLVRGGTGSRSEFEEQPNHLPDKFESGTPNSLGIAGLGAGVRLVLGWSIDAIRAYDMELTNALIEGLSAIPGVRIYGPCDATRSTAVVSFTVAGRRVSEIGLGLDEEFSILCRVGLHCAPAAHKTLGTFPEGTVRIAPSLFTSMQDIKTAIAAVRKIVRR